MLVAFAALAACSGSPSSNAGATDTLAGVRAAIVGHNYADARQAAATYVVAHPKDPDGFYEQARAEALAGNQGLALDALSKAINSGLANAGQALNDPAFDGIRNDARFAALGQKANPTPQSGQDQNTALETGSGTDQVSISQHNGGTEIRAGDVKLKTNF